MDRGGKGPGARGRRALGILWIGPALAYPLLVHAGLAASPRDLFALGLLAVPVLPSAGMLLLFGRSLRSSQTFVERIARRSEPDLDPAKVRYCRRVTKVWCGFFVLNIVLTLALARFAPLSWWTAWTGALAYVAMGLLFAGEYAVRRARFGDRSRTRTGAWHDRDREGP